MNNKTIAEVSKETLAIEAVISSLNPGEFIYYSVLQQKSGVKMDNRGKGFMRTALNRLKREYTVVHGEGIEMSSPENTTRIVAHRVIKIDNSVKRAEKTTSRVVAAHFNELSDESKKHVTLVASTFAMLRNYSHAAKKVFFPKKKIEIAN